MSDDMESTEEMELPPIEEHLPGDGRSWSGRTNITIWLDKDVIAACGPQPASALRIWIETHHPATRRKYKKLAALEAQASLEEQTPEGQEPLNWVPVPRSQQKGKKVK